MTDIDKKETIIKAPVAKPLSERFRILVRHIRREIKKTAYPLVANILHKRALNKARAKNEPLNAIFMVIHESVWKFDRLYWKMNESEDFKPTIVICPYVVQGKEVMIRDMEKAYLWYKVKGYNVVKALKSDGQWMNIKSELKPDLILFTNPHELTKEQFQAKHYLRTLTVYVPYGHQVTKYMNYYAQYNQLFHNIIWKIFTINDMDKQISIDCSDTKGRNVEVTGYPGIDDLIDKNYTPKDVWKKQEITKKKIIWAPHHSIEDNSPLKYSTFLVIADFMKAISIEFINEIQISFKPHPLLMDKLYTHKDWGKNKTDDFFNFWANSSNTQLDLADYTNLFLTSDGIIHDSGSFLAEYLYVNKPALYMVADELLTERFSPLGLMAFNACTHGVNASDIRPFIKNEILNNQDLNMKKREEFTNQCLLNDTEIPSDIIFKKLVDTLR